MLAGNEASHNSSKMNSTDTGATSRFSEVEKFLVFESLIFVSLLTVAGNLLVFLAYFKNKKLRTTNNYFILSLATADLIIGGLSINFYAVYMVLGYWPLGVYVCDFYLSMDYWCCQTSVFNLVAISIDRFCSLKYPIKYRNKRSPNMVFGVVIGIWVLSFLIWVPMIISYQFIVDERTVTHDTCYIQFLYESWYITIITAVLAYYGPIILMGALYAHIYFALLNRKRRVSRQMMRSIEIQSSMSSAYVVSSVRSTAVTDVIENPNSTIQPESVNNGTETDNNGTQIIKNRTETISQFNKEKDDFKAQKRTLKDHDMAMLLIVLIFFGFMITWLPYDIFAVVAPFCPDCISVEWWDFGYLFCYINSTINPFCYALGNRRFRRTFKEILCSSKRSKKYQQQHTRQNTRKKSKKISIW